ncbi:hypothetical protein ACLESD_29180 [Pyxidicoccus sp. 3LFB2]
MSTPLKLLMAALLVLGPLSGFLLGRSTAPALGDGPVLRELAHQRALLEEHLARDVRAPAEVRCAVAASPPASGDTAHLKTELVQAVRDELALRPGEHVPDAGPRAPAPEPSAQSLAALQESHQVIDNAARVRRWTNEDRQTLRRALGEMTPDQRVEVMRRLTTSLNGKVIDLQTQGAPL